MKTQSDYLSDSNSLEEEVSQHLCASPEERLYSTIKGSVLVTQVALAHITAHCNPTVERGPPKQPKIKKLPKLTAKLKMISNVIMTVTHNIETQQ